MCGICGIFNFGDRVPVDGVLLNRMNSTMIHRGPNEAGRFLKHNIGIAMRRLSILDLEGGSQPIHNEDKSLWVVFNGEIFNYRELREMLENRGHQFYTLSDTETILHLYEEFGEDCVQHLRGMFAFALWDSKREELFIARDRIGIKPLFYSVVNGKSVLFGSEIKALLASGLINEDLDLQGLDAFLAYAYIPAPLTIFENVRKLLPGYTMKISDRGVRIRKYWDLYFRPDHSKSEKYFVERFTELFQEAVKMRLLSEVPLGAFLSGGVDSSMVVALMALSSAEAPRTFTVGFSGDVGAYLDERPYARIVADKYGCQHHEIQVKPNISEILGEIVNAFDEPFADDSVIPSYYICKNSKKAVTVALTGLGGDEVFGGYERYLGFRMSLYCDAIPDIVSSLLKPFIESLPEQHGGNSRMNHIKRFMRASHMPISLRYASYVSILDIESRRKLYNPDIAPCIDFDATSEIMTGYFNSSENCEHPIDRAFYQDIKTYLPEDLLALTDRIGMLHSQELRVPFTDHVLMEFCATIPFEMKLKGFKKKYLLKEAARRFIPESVLSHKKQGFCSPMAQWLKSDLQPVCNEQLSKSKILDSGLFSWEFADKIMSDHMAGREMYHRAIFAMIVFQKWLGQPQKILPPLE